MLERKPPFSVFAVQKCEGLLGLRKARVCGFYIVKQAKHLTALWQSACNVTWLCGRYVSGLFALAYDSSSDVRKVVCTGLVQMLHLQQQRLQPHMKEIIEYMLQATQVRTALHDLIAPRTYQSESNMRSRWKNIIFQQRGKKQKSGFSSLEK